jgi:5-(carboxyamino)imidazole ribonucleotide synthase
VSEASHRSTVPIVPPATIGMLGGGQLGGYALVAARSMGYRTLLLEPDAVAPAGRIADEHLVAPYDDTAALRRMGIDCDVVTTEFENPPAAALDVLAAATRVAPAPSSVAIAQDRRAEKAFLIDQGAPVGPYVVVDADSGATSLRGLRFPAVLKTARLGYDGKGQRRVSSPSELHAAWAELGS